MSQHEPSLTQDTVGALVRMHRVARGLTQQALARLCQLSPIYISQIEQGVRIPSVTACRALAAALGCPPRLLVLRVFHATAPAEIQDVLHEEGPMVSDTPTMQEFTPLLHTVQTLPPTTRHQLLQLWQASLALVQDGSGLPPRPPADPAREAAEPYATTLYYWACGARHILGVRKADRRAFGRGPSELADGPRMMAANSRLCSLLDLRVVYSMTSSTPYISRT